MASSTKNERGGRRSGVKNVDYDKWGEFLQDERVISQKFGLDEDGEERLLSEVREYDVTAYDSEEEIRPITKKEIVDDLWAWRDDDGDFSDPDLSVFIQYDDGTVFINGWGSEHSDHYRDHPKKSGIIGASVSTGDYEEVWGYYINERTGKRGLLQTWSEDGESGHTNSYSGYRQTAKYRIRYRETYYWDPNKPNGYYKKGGYRKKIERIRQSNRVPIDH